MPRRPELSPDTLFNALKLFEVFDEDQTLKPRSNQIWQAASTSLLEKVSPSALNSYVRNNRWNLKVNLEKHFKVSVGDKMLTTSIGVAIDSDDSVDYRPCNFSTVEKTRCPPLYFDISLSDDEWRSICPLFKTYNQKRGKGRTYKVLQDGWTNVIYRAFF